jgi:flagellar capping protein FliD
MKNISTSLLLSIATLALTVAEARAADRLQPGQWETTISAGGQDRVMQICVTTAETSAVNGDEKTFEASVLKTAQNAGCTVKDVKVSGNQVTVDATCGGMQATSTTTYHGDWYEQVSSNGSKVRAKRVGPCP